MTFLKNRLARLRDLHPRHLSTGKEIRSLDGVRGFAVLLVLIDHMGDAELDVIPGVNLNSAGAYGVLLFFALSAFLLTFPFWMRPAEELTRWRTWRDYTLRRFFRIFPLYALVLSVTAWVSGDGFQLSDLRNHLLLLDGKRHFWTVLVEVKYYLVLPLFIFAVIWAAKRKWWFGLLGLVAFWVVMKLVLPPIEAAWTPREQLWLHRYLQVFVAGSLIGIAHATLTKNNWSLHSHRWLLELTAWICLLLAVLRVSGIRDALLPESIRMSGQDTSSFALIWPALIFCQLHGTGFMRRMLENLALRYIGFISFSVYLWHRLILNEFKGWEVAAGWRILTFLSLVLVLSTVSYFAVERPLSRIRLFARN